MTIQALRTVSIHVASLALAVALSTVTALAGTTGSISGIVTDAKTGTPVSDARVVAHALSQELTTTTDSRGYFVFFTLPPDNYSITVQKARYATQSSSGYEVEADQTQLYGFEITPETAYERSDQSDVDLPR